MPPGTKAAIPAAPRKTLREWTEQDDGDTSTHPVCTEKDQALHASILLPAHGGSPGARDRLQPPPGLHLAPIG